MSGTTDKIKGYANEVIGNVKQGVGRVVGSDKLEAEGKVQEVKGEGLKVLGEAKDRIAAGGKAVKDSVEATTTSSTVDKVKGFANEAAGKVKQVVGHAIGSPQMEADGLSQEAKGDAQRIAGDVKKRVGL